MKATIVSFSPRKIPFTSTEAERSSPGSMVISGNPYCMERLIDIGRSGTRKISFHPSLIAPPLDTYTVST